MRSWIAYEAPIVWVIKGLKNDPNWNPNNGKQVSGIEEQLRSLPKSPLIARFCKFYGLSFSWLTTDDPIDESTDDPIDESTDVPTDGTEAVSRKPEAVSRKPERALLSTSVDLPAAWNRICVSLPKCAKVTPKRAAHIKARLKEYPPEEWERIFQRIEASAFCRGENGGWKATFDWIISSPDNAVKVLEGKYDRASSPRDPPPSRAANGSRIEYVRGYANSWEDPESPDYIPPIGRADGAKD
jgi:hypothetical protein